MNKVCIALSCILLATILPTANIPSNYASEELTENTWTILPEYGTGNSGIAVVNGKIYVITYKSELKNNIILIYDPQANNWTTKNPTFSKPWEGETVPITSASVYDKIYCFGHGIYHESTLNNKVYCVSTNHWSSIASSSNKRINPSACTVNDKIYLIGGATTQGIDPNTLLPITTATNLVETYDPKTDTWTTKQPLNKPVQYPRTIAVEERIYVFGGGYIQIYDRITDKWITSAEYNDDTCYIYGEATTGKYASQKIYLFGLNAVQIFDPETESFIDGVPFPEHKSPQYPNVTFGNFLQSYRVAVVDDVFYLIGGAASGRLEKQWITTEGRVIKSSQPVSFGVDYRYVPFVYDAKQQADNSGFEPAITIAGIAAAASIITAACVLVYHFRIKAQDKTKT